MQYHWESMGQSPSPKWHRFAALLQNPENILLLGTQMENSRNTSRYAAILQRAQLYGNNFCKVVTLF